MNKSNCMTCDYKEMDPTPGQHCYMFKEPPENVCYSHSGHKVFVLGLVDIGTVFSQMAGILNKQKET